MELVRRTTEVVGSIWLRTDLYSVSTVSDIPTRTLPSAASTPLLAVWMVATETARTRVTPGMCVTLICRGMERERERERNVLFNDALNTFYHGYMASDIWVRTILIVRKETRCRHIGYSYRCLGYSYYL